MGVAARKLVLVALSSLSFSGCGDQGSSSPTSPSSSGASLVPAGTVLSVVSGETGSPVANAQLVVAGRTYRADPEGRLTLPEAFARGSYLDILAPGFLDRQTLLRDAAAVRFALWPRESPTGMDPAFTFEIVYTNAGSGNRQRMLRIRPGTTAAYVLPSLPIRNDRLAMTSVNDAAEMLTEITGGEIQFIVAESAPPGAVAFDLNIDPGDPALVNAVAVAKRRVTSSSITGGTVVYVTMETVRSSSTAHELGHMFGLEHSSGPDDVMSTERNRRRGLMRFSARESLAMRLMLQRLPGNEQPDNDRTAPAASLRESGESSLSLVVCER